MTYHVNTPGHALTAPRPPKTKRKGPAPPRRGTHKTWKVPSAGIWTDGFLTRLFEYPTIGENLSGLEEAQSTGVSLNAVQGTAVSPYKQAGTDQWDWLKLMDGDSVWAYVWDRPPPHPEGLEADDPPKVKLSNQQAITNARLPTALLRRSWKVSPNDMHTLRFFGGTPTTLSLIEAIDQLFAKGTGATSKANCWNRAWLYCDHVISATHIEALLFARRRRVPAAQIADAEKEINDLGKVSPVLTPSTARTSGSVRWS